jgi:hypothetical protein
LQLRYLNVVVATVGACALVSGAAAGTAAPTANTATFEDSTGEQPGAPDITRVVVSNNDASVITFTPTVPGRGSLTEDMLVEYTIDADNNPATGDPDPNNLGGDYAIELFGGTANLFRWDGTTYSRRGADPPQSSLIFNGLIVRINAADLGNTTRFNFNALVVVGVVVDRNTGDIDFSKAIGDLAPDPGHGFYNYSVRVGALKLNAKSFTLSPRRPVAGRTFAASMVATRSDTGATLTGGQVTCTATVGGKRLAARVHRFAGSQARCTWAIPSSARGQKIRGTVTVVFEGRRVSRSFSATVG